MSLGFLTFGCTEYFEEKSDENKNYIKEKIDKVDISLQTLNNSKTKIISFGLSPLVPA